MNGKQLFGKSYGATRHWSGLPKWQREEAKRKYKAEQKQLFAMERRAISRVIPSTPWHHRNPRRVNPLCLIVDCRWKLAGCWSSETRDQLCAIFACSRRWCKARFVAGETIEGQVEGNPFLTAADTAHIEKVKNE